MPPESLKLLEYPDPEMHEDGPIQWFEQRAAEGVADGDLQRNADPPLVGLPPDVGGPERDARPG